MEEEIDQTPTEETSLPTEESSCAGIATFQDTHNPTATNDKPTEEPTFRRVRILLFIV